MKKVLVRKGIVLLLAVSMLFSAAACGKKDNVREKQKMSDADKDAVYTYEAIDLNRDENESGYVQFVGDSMYSIVYVYDEETYESTQYCSNCKVVRAPEYYFSQWDQADVKSIVSIRTCCNSNGTCTQILVFYESKEALDE